MIDNAAKKVAYMSRSESDEVWIYIMSKLSSNGGIIVIGKAARSLLQIKNTTTNVEADTKRPTVAGFLKTSSETPIKYFARGGCSKFIVSGLAPFM